MKIVKYAIHPKYPCAKIEKCDDVILIADGFIFREKYKTKRNLAGKELLVSPFAIYFDSWEEAHRELTRISDIEIDRARRLLESELQQGIDIHNMVNPDA